MASAEFADGSNEIENEEFESAKGELLWHILRLYPNFGMHFMHGEGRMNEKRDLAKRINLSVIMETNGPPKRPGEPSPEGLEYGLEATAILHQKKEVQDIDAEESLVVFISEERKCILPREWIFEALEEMDADAREIIAEHLIIPKREKFLVDERRWELDSEIEALSREYHHILGDLD